MNGITAIDGWQLRRLNILADMLEAMIGSYSANTGEENGIIQGLINEVREFRAFFSDAIVGNIENIPDKTSGWLLKLESIEAHIISHLFSSLKAEAIEIIHTSCYQEGKKWGHIMIINDNSYIFTTIIKSLVNLTTSFYSVIYSNIVI